MFVAEFDILHLPVLVVVYSTEVWKQLQEPLRRALENFLDARQLLHGEQVATCHEAYADVRIVHDVLNDVHDYGAGLKQTARPENHEFFGECIQVREN